MSDTRTSSDAFRVDKGWVRAAFERAAPGYDAVAVLQREVERRLLERLDAVRLTPRRVLDVGAGTGVGSAALAGRFPRAEVVAVDLALAMLVLARRRALGVRGAGPWSALLARAARWLAHGARHRFVCADAEGLPFVGGSMDLLFSNLTLQWCHSVDRAFGEFRRVLGEGGLLTFTTFGPDTLKELRASWAQVDAYNHVNAFFDMHDIGDALTRAGFAGTVMDVEHFTLTYREVSALMRDLKTLGAHNVSGGRPRGLASRQRLQRLAEAYEPLRRDGSLPATYEVVYGHAWVPEGQAVSDKKPGGAVPVSLERLRRPRG